MYFYSGLEAACGKLRTVLGKRPPSACDAPCDDKPNNAQERLKQQRRPSAQLVGNWSRPAPDQLGNIAVLVSALLICAKSWGGHPRF